MMNRGSDFGANFFLFAIVFCFVLCHELFRAQLVVGVVAAIQPLAWELLPLPLHVCLHNRQL